MHSPGPGDLFRGIVELQRGGLRRRRAGGGCSRAIGQGGEAASLPFLAAVETAARGEEAWHKKWAADGRSIFLRRFNAMLLEF
jgi:hypothetical protein